MERDIETAIKVPEAMSAGERRVDELKIGIGIAGTIATLTEGLITPLGGLGTVIEGIYDLKKAGHAYRLSHHNLT